MKFIATPVKGMNDFLPSDMKLREHTLSMIKETYASYGFSQIETPAMEHIENLTSNQGGENEKLIFKVMKRGADLARAMEKEGAELADNGLRYDLTVPLSRYYANNSNELPSPFKALQIGNVWRADKPQKGRFRQFTQCDIDILGDDSILAEVELIAATSNVLYKILSQVNIKDFTVHINDRRILKAMTLYAGFPEDSQDVVYIILDKLDKIGIDGVKDALVKEGFASEAVDKYTAIFDKFVQGVGCEEFCNFLNQDYINDKVVKDIDTIISCVKTMTEQGVKLVFDPTLVRGMSYYTGTIFEITLDNYNFSVAGGGRYDEMIGKFSNQKVCACGFSIGFERIITILKDFEAEKLIDTKNKKAFLIDKKASVETMVQVFEKASALRKEGWTVTVQPLKKNAKFQVEKLEADGYSDIEKVFER